MTLLSAIDNAKNSDELNRVVNSIKKQENGFFNALASHLKDAFWYCDLTDDLDAQKSFMIKVAISYPDNLQNFE